MQENIRAAKLNNIKDVIAGEVIKSVTVLPGELVEEIRKSSRKAEGIEKKVLEGMLKNCEIAEKENIPLCQDTGIFEIWFELGRESILKDINVNDLFTEAVRQGHKKGGLRDSMTGPPSPVIHIESSNKKNTRVTITPRGFGSENYTKLHMIDPNATFEKISEIIVEDVKSANGRPCPPYMVGIGIGGTASQAVELSARALTEIDFKFTDREKDLLNEINKLSHGAGGMGGSITALAVKIKERPSHIAGKALGVHIGCWSNRVRRFFLEVS
ncbi:MAG: fumarate hydratase [Elusimicrobia bacterium]|jgi:fumarate hydratase subunit alpha|nr:fumarate hydratase [Elusimicrobiota bacterium]